MPWKQTDPMTEKTQMIIEYLSGDYEVAELARRHGVSRKSVYKWIGRHEQESWAGLAERGRAPQYHPNQLSAPLEQAILGLKKRWPDWGAPKLRHKLRASLGPDEHCPAESTVSGVLKKHGLVKPPRRRRRAIPGGVGALSQGAEPNALWCVDFKGWWRTGDGRRCEPLTVTDAWSRYLLRCVGLSAGTGAALVRPHFELLFREYGLPEAIRSDNGPPFASTGLAGLSALSVWWLRLGLRLERIEPGCPQQNGCHERMHLALEQSQARRARTNLAAQQRALAQFRQEYNQERPHEALAQRVPGALYQPSARPFPSRLPPPREYPQSWERRQVRGWGQMKWGGHEVAVSRALAGEGIGLEPCGDGEWKVWFEQLQIATFDERARRLRGIPRLPKAKGQEVAA